MHYLYTWCSGQFTYKLTEQAPGDRKDIHKIDLISFPPITEMFLYSVCPQKNTHIGCEYPHTVLIIGGSLHTYSLDLQFSNLVLFKCLTLQSYHKPLPTDHQHSIYTGNDVTNVFKHSQVWHLTPDFHLRGTSHHTKYYIGHGSVRKGVNHST